MDFLVLATLVAAAFWVIKNRDQRQRIALLAQHLGPHQIEKHMETLTQGYLRALGEADAERRDQIFSLLQQTELLLDAEFTRFANDFAQVDEAQARVSRLPVYVPGLVQLLPQATLDMRQLLAIHAEGIHRLVAATHMAARDRAFTLSAELFLMQHSCHWFCKSKTVASARMMARHQTAHAQLVAAVSPETRAAYNALTG